jgi:hypothetical protein
VSILMVLPPLRIKSGVKLFSIAFLGREASSAALRMSEKSALRVNQAEDCTTRKHASPPPER